MRERGFYQEGPSQIPRRESLNDNAGRPVQEISAKDGAGVYRGVAGQYSKGTGKFSGSH